MLGRPNHTRGRGVGAHGGQAESRAAPGLIELAAAAEPPAETVEILFFRVGGVLFALPAQSVQQVERVGETIAPSVPAAAGSGRPAREQLVLAAAAGVSRVRLGVDEVLEVAALPLESIYALPRLVADRQRGGYVAGLAVRGDELAILLEADALPDHLGPGATSETAPPQVGDESERREDAAEITVGAR